MGKILIITFQDEDNIYINRLLHSFQKEWNDSEQVKTFFTSSSLQFNNLEINHQYRTVKMGGRDIRLTNYEFEILYLLAKHLGQVFSKEQIYEHICNMPCVGAENNVVSLIHRIRKKIEPNPAKPIYILTVWGIGYKFNNNFEE